MSNDVNLSDYCLISHQEWMRSGGPKPRLTPLQVLRYSLLYIDRKMHFTGLRGATWRVLGIDRSVKNPNLCNS